MFILSDSFDRYAATADLADRGYANDDATKVQFHATNGRFGGGCVQVTDDDKGLRIPVVVGGAAPQTVFFSASVKVSALPAAADYLAMVYDASGVAWGYLKLNPSGSISAYNGTAFIRGTTVASVPVDEYFRLEVRWHPNGSPLGRCEILFDGVTVLDNYAAWDQYGNQTIGAIKFMGAVGTTTTWDDIVIMDDQGTSFNDHMGDLLIEARSPTVDTAQQDFTASNAGDNFAEVDDVAQDGDAGYNSSNTVNDEDLFTHEDLSSTPTLIHACVVNLMVRDTGVNRGLKASCKSNVTTSRGSEITLTGGYAFYQTIYEDDPDTATAWDGAGVDAAEFGYQVSS